MSENKKILGSDLKLIDLEYGCDLALTERKRTEIGKEKQFGDLETIECELNLGQAILSRLRTRKGELLELGYPDYGSRLCELIGRPNNERTRELVKSITRNTLLQEARIKEITDISIRTFKDDLSRIDIDITVIPIESNIPLNIVYPFHLEVA